MQKDNVLIQRAEAMLKRWFIPFSPDDATQTSDKHIAFSHPVSDNISFLYEAEKDNGIVRDIVVIQKGEQKIEFTFADTPIAEVRQHFYLTRMKSNLISNNEFLGFFLDDSTFVTFLNSNEEFFDPFRKCLFQMAGVSLDYQNIIVGTLLNKEGTFLIKESVSSIPFDSPLDILYPNIEQFYQHRKVLLGDDDKISITHQSCTEAEDIFVHYYSFEIDLRTLSLSKQITYKYYENDLLYEETTYDVDDVMEEEEGFICGVDIPDEFFEIYDKNASFQDRLEVIVKNARCYHRIGEERIYGRFYPDYGFIATPIGAIEEIREIIQPLIPTGPTPEY